MSQDHAPPLAHRQVLSNVATHLRHLRKDVATISTAVSEVLSDSDMRNVAPDVIHDLQKIDLLQQSIEDLARLNDALACAWDGRVTATDALTLASTRALVEAPDDLRVQLPGHVDLF